ncbi:sensor histidine kinase [Halosimplex carlsbadense]|uniref:sensor histidine kinase n=1 Tax=Halosimplex carlsbadense TaxID=171164 RepID=UPI001267FDCB|nr:PAS domain-containing sensor histidine kinase [Halosimplex carlsbadense]
MSSTDGPPDRVRVLVAHDRNRELLAEWLGDTYEVLSGLDDEGTAGGGDGEGPFAATDLCLVDPEGFAANRERLRTWKDRADPVFAPVVLVTEEPLSEGLDPESWESIDGLYVVDDVVQIPVEKAVLFRRLENLLSRRSLSTDLARSYERAEERFASLFHATPDPALVLSEGHIIYVNDALCEEFGVDRDDIHWRHIAELDALPPATRDQIESQIERVLAAESETDAADWTGGDDPPEDLREAAVDDGTDDAVETGPNATLDDAVTDEALDERTETVVVERPDGERRYAETNVKPMILDERRNVAVVMRDVTERRRRKRELERKNERLEEFASIVSHDLRNPIQVLDGRLSHLEESAVDDGALADGESLADQVEPMRRSVDRMSDLVDDMLTLAREGTAVEETEVVDLAAVAEEAWTTTDAPAATFAVDGDLALAADPSRLRQLFENCFRNAVDHGPSDVTVRVGDLPDGRGFFVEDDGPGIPESERDEIFELGHTTSDDGTGLGLGIVSEIVDAHGWTVSVTESEGGGARFEIVVE